MPILGENCIVMPYGLLIKQLTFPHSFFFKQVRTADIVPYISDNQASDSATCTTYFIDKPRSSLKQPQYT